ncbi:uncharacterized protein LOC102804179 [Saccoglossus kowalevskii]
MAIDDQYVYWTDWNKHQLQRVDKQTGINPEGVGYAIFQRAMGIHLHLAYIETTTSSLLKQTSTNIQVTTVTNSQTILVKDNLSTTVSNNLGTKSEQSVDVVTAAGASGATVIIIATVVIFLIVYYKRRRAPRDDGFDRNIIEFNVHDDSARPTAPPAPETEPEPTNAANHTYATLISASVTEFPETHYHNIDP